MPSLRCLLCQAMRHPQAVLEASLRADRRGIRTQLDTFLMQYIIVMQDISYIQECKLKGTFLEGKKNERMKSARMESGLSQQQLADAVGATRQTIGLIEAGRYNPSLKLCTAICKTLGKTLDDLFWE